MELARIDLSQMIIVADAPPGAASVKASIPPNDWPDLTPRGYPAIGYWPIVDIAPTYNPLTQALGAPVLVIDQQNVCVTRTPAVTNLPPERAAKNQAIAAFEALAAAGLSITSTGTPALTGTYPTDLESQAKMTSVAAYINANAKFPAAVAHMPIPLLNGSAAVASTTAEYLAVVSAIADFVTACDLALDTGSQFPTSSVTIP